MLEEKRQQIDTKYKEIDSVSYQHLDSVYSVKNSSNHIDNIDYFVDRALEKRKLSSYKARGRCSTDGLWGCRINRKSIGLKVLAVILAISLLSVAFMSSITSNSTDDSLPADIAIINVYSYPSVGGKWTVMFTTVGKANLTIAAVNGTTWSNTNNSGDLRFLELKCGNETLDYEWIDNSVFIENYSSDETGYEISKVLTSGRHTLMFRFGDDVAYAYNDASNWWNTSWSKRAPIYLNVSSGETPENYTVLLNITYDSDMNSNFSDLRFVRYADNTTNLSHWIENKNDGNWVLVWVEFMDNITTINETHAWMYYGNPSAESISNGTATFQFFDDFPGTSLDTSTWSATGSYSVNNGITITTGSVYTDSTVGSSPQNLTFEMKASYSGPDASYSGLEIADAQSTSGSNGGSNALAYHMTDSGGQDISLWGADGTVASYNIVSQGTLSPNPTLGTYYIFGFSFNASSQISYFYQYLNYSDIDRATYSGTWNYSFYLWLGYFAGSAAGSTNIDDVTVKWVRIRKYTSTEPIVFVGNEESTPSPIATLEFPSDGYITSNSIIIFNCSAIDFQGLKNVTLYHNISGSWESNETKNISGTSNSTTWTINDIPEGTYVWNCLVYDTDSNSDWGNKNFTFTIEKTPPDVYINSPSGTIADTTPTINVTFGEVVDTAWYNIDHGENIALCTSCSSVDDVYLNLAEGSYTIYVFANDSAGNVNDTESSFFTINMNGSYYDTYDDNSSIAIYNNVTWHIGNVSAKCIVEDIGDGYDGALTVNDANTIINNYTYLTGNESSGNTNISVNNGSEFSNGDEILIIQMQNGTGPGYTGNYEFRTITSGGGTNTFTLDSGLENEYGSGTFNTDPASATQVVKVPQYTDMTVNSGGSITAPAWNGYTGGIVVFRATETVTVNGAINVSEKGYRGGYHGVSNNCDGAQGESWSGKDTSNTCYGYGAKKLANKGGGGSYICGGGGEYGGGATDSDDWNGPGGDEYARKGEVYGTANLSRIFFGSGGGGMWDGNDPDISDGGDGGGIIMVYADTIVAVADSFLSNGQTTHGQQQGSYTYGSSGGAGGSIYLSADSIQATTNFSKADKGLGNHEPLRDGGDGGVGRIRLDYNSLSGNTYPTCYSGNATTTYLNGSFTSTAINTTSNILTIKNITWTEENTDGNNYITVEISVNNGVTWYNATNGQGLIGFTPGNSLVYRVNFTVNGTKGISLLDMNITWGGQAAPVINSYDISNSTGSKLNNVTGLLEVNNEYCFAVNITDSNGWADIECINITAWYDNGSDSSTYNQTTGGNLNMYLQYENTTVTASFNMLWPDDEAQLILVNCTETIINNTTRVINISFIPLSQVRWASSNESWNSTQNVTNDPYSWNFNITVTDSTNRKAWKEDEYGVYRYTSILPESDWVDVYALPGFSDNSSIVTIPFSSNYDFNMSLYFEENLTHTLFGNFIPIANNVKILANTDLNDDITSDKIFQGIGEINAIDIFNVSGLFANNGTNQTVDVQFNVYIPFGTLSGKYTARVATKIAQK